MTRRSLLAAAPFSGALGLAAGIERQIKITSLETDLLRLPSQVDAFTISAKPVTGSSCGCGTNAGITGWGSSSFGAIAGGPRVIQRMLERAVSPLVLGQDPAFPKTIRADLWRALQNRGVPGLTRFAASVVDIAVWDILGKAARLPVYKMLGAVHGTLPAYSVCVCYRNDPDRSKYRREMDTILENGYRAFQIHVGTFSLDDDVERIELARTTAGKDIRIMLDASHRFERVEALRRGRIYRELGCFWYKDPLPPWDFEGYTELAQALDMRIAGGENEYGPREFSDLLGMGGLHVLQPDNRRAAGPTDWMEIAATSSLFGVKLASKEGGPVAMNMLCAIPDAIYVASSGAGRVVNGEAAAPKAPGMSSEIAGDYIARYRIS